MEGEKATKLFCSMEKQNSVRKYNSKLNVEHDGISAVITEQKDIEKETQRYYQELFKGQDDQLEIGTIEDFLEDDLAIQCPKLSNAQKSSLERDIDLKELTWYLKNTKANTSPGSSGFSNEFFKFFWRDLKTFIIKYINFSFQTGMLSVSQRLGIITVIPKGDKDKTFLKNWRPLTLLDSLYEMISGVIAGRIRPVLDTIIHGDQKGFIANRYIGEAIRSTYDILSWAKENKRLAYYF